MDQQRDGGRADGQEPRRRRVGLLAALLLLAAAVLLGTGPSSPPLALVSVTDPNPPTNVAVTPADRALSVSWTAGSEPKISGYRVYLDGVLAASPTGTSVSLTGLVNGRAYAVTVRTATTSGGTTYVGTVGSPPVTGTPRDAVPPAAPAGVTAVRGDGQVSVSWTANSADYDADGYRVLRNGTAVSGLISGRATISYLDSGLVNDTTYSYTVQTHDTSGNWSVSSAPAVTATPTDLTPPAAPTGLVAIHGDGRVSLTWTANAEPDVATYRVLRDGVEIATVTGTSYLDTGLTNDVTYTYALVAVDGHGNRSPNSGSASATPGELTPPAVPTGLAATRGENQVTLSWTANTEPDLATYRLLRNGVEIATLTTTSYLDTGLTNDVTYTYAVAAVDMHGNRSANSATVTATPTDLTAPAGPTGLSALAGDTQVRLAWTANGEPDVALYRVFRDGVLVATVTGTSYLDTGLTNGTAYSYAVAAVDGHGNVSPQSALVGAVTPMDLAAPGAPAGLVATPGDGGVTLSWTANTEPDLATYQVLRDGVEIATVTGVTYVDSGLTNDTTYAYTLVAVDTNGNRSAESAPVLGTPTDLTAPAAPTGLAATPGDGQVTLAWTANTESDLDGYAVLRDGVEIARVTGTSYLDTAVSNDTAYSYTVVAVDTHGNRSPASASRTATPTDLTPPAAPTGLAATPGDGQVSLTWAANTEPDLADYRVLRDGVEIATVTGTAYVDSGLANGTTYSYRLVAVDGHGNRSAASSTATAQPADASPPAAPAAPTATAGENQVSLTWPANAEPDLATYRVLRDGVEIATVTGTSYVDTGLTNGTSYSYTLVAVDTSGNRSAASGAASATPVDGPPAAPGGVSVTSGDQRVTVRWTASPEPDVVEYRVLAEDGSTAATATPPATSATVTGLTNGTTYRFTIVAVDAAGHLSAASTVATVTPAPASVPAQGAGESGGIAVSSDGRYVVIGTRAQREAADTNTAYELYLVDRTAGTARRIAPMSAAATGAGDATNTSAPVISDDGRYIALATTAALVPTDRNGLADVYRLDTTTGTWALVSVPASGAVSSSVAGTALQPGSSVYATSPSVVMSGDGDLLLFYSARADLVAGDTNGAVDVFAKTMSTGAVSRVSTTATGGNLPRTATGPALALTPDGRFALFPATTSTGPTVLYRKTLSGAGAGDVTVVSSVTVSGRVTEYGVYRDAGDVAISDDGRYVALVTAAKLGTTTPSASWTTGLAYRVDTATGAVVALGTGQTTAWEHQVELDPTGRYAFFATAAAELPGDGNGHTDHYRRDLAGGTPGPLVLATADASGAATAGPIGSVAAAEYGRLFAITGDSVLVTTTQALIPADTNRLRDLYTKDLVTGSIGSPLA